MGPFLDPPAALMAHVGLGVLGVVELAMLDHLVLAVRLKGALVALLHLGRPRHLHGEAEELEGLVEGPLPRT